MKQIIELYMMKLEHGHLTYKELDAYEELIKLYMSSLKRRLETSIKQQDMIRGPNNDNR